MKKKLILSVAGAIYITAQVVISVKLAKRVFPVVAGLFMLIMLYIDPSFLHSYNEIDVPDSDITLTVKSVPSINDDDSSVEIYLSKSEAKNNENRLGEFIVHYDDFFSRGLYTAEEINGDVLITYYSGQEDPDDPSTWKEVIVGLP